MEQCWSPANKMLGRKIEYHPSTSLLHFIPLPVVIVFLVRQLIPRVRYIKEIDSIFYSFIPMALWRDHARMVFHYHTNKVFLVVKESWLLRNGALQFPYIRQRIKGQFPSYCFPCRALTTSNTKTINQLSCPERNRIFRYGLRIVAFAPGSANEVAEAVWEPHPIWRSGRDRKKERGSRLKMCDTYSRTNARKLEGLIP